jgi:hypothetical protein
MGVRFPGGGSKTIVTASVAGPLEAVIATAPAIDQAIDGQPIMILWYVAATNGGAGSYTPNWNLRRGNAITSTLINVAQAISGGGINDVRIFSGSYFDLPGISGRLQYSLSLNQTGTGTITIQDAFIAAIGL